MNKKVQARKDIIHSIEDGIGVRIVHPYGKITDALLEQSCTDLRRQFPFEIRAMLSAYKLLKKQENIDNLHASVPQDPEVRKIILDQICFMRSALQNIFQTRPHAKYEVAGIKIKTVASNIRRFDYDWGSVSLEQDGIGMEGDIVVAEVLNDNGSTNKIENIHGRDERIYKGDKVLVVLGNRHTGTSEYGDIPDGGWDIRKDPVVDLLCHGGIVGRALSIPTRMGACPVQLRILGLLQNSRRENVNMAGFYPEWDQVLNKSAPIIANCGTGADIGKTTTASAIIRQLKKRGLRVAATKVAGTGRFRDLLELRDAGADIFSDFPDVGLPSTYTSPERYLPAIITLLNKLNSYEPDIIVAEFGGDIIEANIPTFFQNEDLKGSISAIVHSAGDIMGISGSLAYYKNWGLDVPLYLTLPKGRNDHASKQRIDENIQLPSFSSLRDDEVSVITEELLSRISNKKGG